MKKRIAGIILILLGIVGLESATSYNPPVPILVLVNGFGVFFSGFFCLVGINLVSTKLKS